MTTLTTSARYETVIWDWNGTLLDDLAHAIKVMNDLLTGHGYAPVSVERYGEIFDFPVRDYYARAGFDLAHHDFPALSDSFCDAFENGLYRAGLFPQVQDTLSRLSHLRHFVLSNTEQETLHRMLARFELMDAFEAAHGLNHTLATGKQAIGAVLIEQHVVNHRTAILIGDTTHDADVAQALGVDCVLVATGHNSRARLEQVGVPVCASLDEVCALLESGAG